jgi:hypothetical protein
VVFFAVQKPSNTDVVFFLVHKKHGPRKTPFLAESSELLSTFRCRNPGHLVMFPHEKQKSWLCQPMSAPRPQGPAFWASFKESGEHSHTYTVYIYIYMQRGISFQSISIVSCYLCIPKYIHNIYIYVYIYTYIMIIIIHLTSVSENWLYHPRCIMLYIYYM